VSRVRNINWALLTKLWTVAKRLCPLGGRTHKDSKFNCQVMAPVELSSCVCGKYASSEGSIYMLSRSFSYAVTIKLEIP
jgi:hypothetical protein